MKVLVALLLINVVLFPQDFLKLYRNDIPDNIKIDQSISNSLNLNIIRNISLSPELIYLTLKYYQSYDGKSFDTKLFENLKSNERYWFEKRNEWVKLTKEKISQTENFDLISLTDQSLNDLIIDVRKKETDLPIVLNNSEINLRDFYLVKYYIHDPDLKYDININYSDLRSERENERLKYFKDVSENPKIVISPQDLIKKVSENWYLLSESKELVADEILIECIDTENIRKGHTPFSVFVGGVFINNIIDLDEDIKFPDLNRTITMNTESSLPQFSIGAGYKVYFKKSASYLSFIDFQLFYSFGYLSKDDTYQYRFENLENTSTATIKELISSTGSYQLSSFNSLGMKIATPFYQLNFLSLDLALNISWDSFKFTPQIVFTHSRIRSSSLPPSSVDTISFSQVILYSPKNKSQLSFMPMIDANLRIEDGFNARISFGYGYFNMGIVYSTSLFKN